MRALLALTLLTLVLSGCSQKGDGSGSPTTSDSSPAPATASSYTITLSDLPVVPLEAGAQFRFNSTITGDATRYSDHVGAHLGNKSTDAPSTTAYPVICQHTVGNLPGRYLVTCTAPQQPGPFYLRGHARITVAGNATNWWSAEATLTVAPLQG